MPRMFYIAVSCLAVGVTLILIAWVIAIYYAVFKM
jgi:hypothetical protein